jgi:beta-glucosidase
MKKQALSILILALLLTNATFGQTSKTPAKSIDEQVAELMKTMTLEDKIGQMLIVDYSSIRNSIADITNYKIGNVLFGADSDPELNTAGSWAALTDSLQKTALAANLHIPLFIGADAIHGHSNVSNATIFPQNIGMGCTRNARLVSEEGKITASEVSATGIRLVFSPSFVTARDERWGGTYESYGEDPALVTQMGNAYITGFNSFQLPEGGSALACPKYSGAVSYNAEATEGKNAVVYSGKIMPVTDSALVNSGAIMFSSMLLANDQKTENQLKIIQTLKKNSNFKGFVVSDWETVTYMQGEYQTVVKNAINAGIDMFMETSSYKQFIETMKLCVTNGDISKERIDDAVKRILTQKIKIGLFKHPYAYKELLEKIDDKGDKNIARQCVRESAVILLNKNNGLPISKKAVRIHIAGSGANNMAMQCGGWTIGWQGLGEKEIPGLTFLEALNKACSGTKITYSKNGQGATGAEVGIVVIGEEPYAEWYGNKKELFLSQEDINAVMNIKNSNVPVICVLLTGRPLILDPILNYCDAIVEGWLPGPEIEGLTDVLFGDVKPKGLLSQSWPVSMKQISENVGDANYNPLFPYGTGITTLESAKSSAPRLLSANVVKKGGAIELAFSKPISEYSAIINFSITTAEGTQRPLSGELKADNPNCLILALKDSIKPNQKVQINFETGEIKAKDGGTVQPFKHFMVYNPITTLKKIFKIPAMIQAEKYSDQREIDIQDCWDDKGGQAIVLEKGEWVEYLLNSSFPGFYSIIFRIQATKKTELSLSIDGREVGTVKIPATKPGAWSSVEMKKVYITNGKQDFTISAKGETVSLNWISFDSFVNFTSK